MNAGSKLLLAAFLIAYNPAGALAQLPTGTWRLNGNGFVGVLDIASATADGKVTGTILDEPLDGTYDQKTRAFRFVRYRNGVGFQAWKGYLFTGPDERAGHRSVAGTFVDLQAPGAPEVGWFATQDETLQAANPVSKELLAADLKRLQGDWDISGMILQIGGKTNLPAELGLNEVGKSVTIDGPHLKVAGKVVASIDNELPRSSLHRQVGLGGFRLIMFTTPEGKGIPCSYLIMEDDSMEIACPHTCSCHRGSGQVVTLKRIKKTVDPARSSGFIRRP